MKKDNDIKMVRSLWKEKTRELKEKTQECEMVQRCLAKTKDELKREKEKHDEDMSWIPDEDKDNVQLCCLLTQQKFTGH